MPPIGDHAWDTMPCSASAARTAGCRKYGWTSTWFTAGTTVVASSRLGEVVGHEVGDADGPDLAVGKQRLQGAVGVDREVEPAGERLVQDQQVDRVDAELAGGLVERVQRRVVPVVADPDLGLDEDLVASQPGLADRLADLTLVAVRGGGVDVPVADLAARCGPRRRSRRVGSGRRRSRGRAWSRRCSG